MCVPVGDLMEENIIQCSNDRETHDHKQQLKTLNFMIGQQVRQARKGKELTLTDIARLLGVSYQYIHQCEAGEVMISAPRLLLISHILDVSPDFFFETGRAYLDSS